MPAFLQLRRPISKYRSSCLTALKGHRYRMFLVLISPNQNASLPELRKSREFIENQIFSTLNPLTDDRKHCFLLLLRSYMCLFFCSYVDHSKSLFIVIIILNFICFIRLRTRSWCWRFWRNCLVNRTPSKLSAMTSNPSDIIGVQRWSVNI